jgi:hypothetical protein
MAKTPKIKEERPLTVIKPVIGSLSTDVKTKIASAFQAVVAKIKETHL